MSYYLSALSCTLPLEYMYMLVDGIKECGFLSVSWPFHLPLPLVLDVPEAFLSLLRGWWTPPPRADFPALI